MVFYKIAVDPSYTRFVEDHVEQFTALMSPHTYQADKNQQIRKELDLHLKES